MFKKIIYIIVLTFFVTSCGDTVGSIKRGLTGAKSDSTDEFLVEKKDPLILPPDFENLPNPTEQEELEEEVSSFEKILVKKTPSNEDISSSADTVEESIIQKIRKK